MKKFITFNTDEVDDNLIRIYDSIKESARSSALLYVDTIKVNNECHFTYFIENINKSIKRLKEFYLETDKRSEYFKPLDIKELIKEAKDFFKQDLY
ncbi:MAG: hypothetical protein PHF86_01665 [Candidatus Nanoarchaeia archaeon]|nr:hypothetical protein [Candidatus Nanoarchaeia archaeon]